MAAPLTCDANRAAAANELADGPAAEVDRLRQQVAAEFVAAETGRPRAGLHDRGDGVRGDRLASDAKMAAVRESNPAAPGRCGGWLSHFTRAARLLKLTLPSRPPHVSCYDSGDPPC